MDNDELLAVLRGDIADVNQRIDDTRLHLGSQIEQTNSRIDETNNRIDETNRRVDQRIDGAKADLVGQIKETKADLVRQIRETKADLVEQIQETKTDLTARIDTVRQSRLHAAGFLIALAAAIAVLGTFVFQVIAAL